MNQITKAEMRKRLGNITQLQDLLFGEKIEKYDSQLEQYSQRLQQLESETKKFHLIVKERLEQLEESLGNKINSVASTLEKRIKYLEINTQAEQIKIQQEIDALSQNSYDNIDFLQKSLNANTNSLKTEITQSKVALDRDLQLLKQQIFERLESNLAELSASKVSRSTLAEVLFELCLKVKGSDFNFEQEETKTEEASVDFILPEQSKLQTINPEKASQEENP